MRYTFSFLVLMTFSNTSLLALDHSYKLYAEVLKKNVKEKGQQTLVNYSSLKKSPQKLDQFLSEIQSVKRSEYNKWSKEQKLSFLINSYNAFTLKLIRDNYPLKSIKDLGSFFSSPWKKEFFTLFGKKSWLDQIEHDMIRKNFKEPRIHFAVNCASMGCPSLAVTPYRADKLDQQLQSAAVNFITNKERNYIKGDKIYLSKIFDWYGDDFEEMTGVKYIDFIASVLPQAKKLSIKVLSYDWSLNDYQEKN